MAAKTFEDKVTLIPAIVEQVNVDPNEYKPFSDTLSFDGKVIVLIPVPSSEVTKKGDTFTLTLEGYQTLLRKHAEMKKQLFYKYYQGK